MVNETKKIEGSIESYNVKQTGKGKKYVVFSVNKVSLICFDADIIENIEKEMSTGKTYCVEYQESTYMKDNKPVVSRTVRSFSVVGESESSKPEEKKVETKRTSEYVKLGALKDSLSFWDIYLQNQRYIGNKCSFSIEDIYNTAKEFEDRLLGNEEFNKTSSLKFKSEFSNKVNVSVAKGEIEEYTVKLEEEEE